MLWMVKKLSFYYLDGYKLNELNKLDDLEGLEAKI